MAEVKETSKAANWSPCTPDMEQAYIRRIKELEKALETIVNDWLEEFDRSEDLAYKLNRCKKKNVYLQKKLKMYEQKK